MTKCGTEDKHDRLFCSEVIAVVEDSLLVLDQKIKSISAIDGEKVACFLSGFRPLLLWPSYTLGINLQFIWTVEIIIIVVVE